MAKAEVVYLIGAGCCGLLSLILIVASFSSEVWVTADIRPTSGSSDDVSHANHGLFTGTLERKLIGTVSTHTIYATCLISDNVCAWSCMETQSEREAEVEQLYRDGTGVFRCPKSASSKRQQQPRIAIDDNDFMQAGFYIVTITFLSVALAANVFALGFNGYNIIYNPIEMYAAPMAVMAYYAISAGAIVLTLAIWSSEFNGWTSKNIAILDTLTHVMSSEASLGWAYYLLIPAELSQLGAIALINLREYLLKRKAVNQTIQPHDGRNDANHFIY